MQNNIIIRRLDNLGRVLIPKEIRRRLGLINSDPLVISVNANDEIVIKRYESNKNKEESSDGKN